VSGQRPRNDFTENLEAVARGVRRLEQIQDPILREAVAAALRLREREIRIDPASRARMRNTVLAALAPAKPTLADRLYGVFAVIGKPAPILVRALVIGFVIASMLGGATVASADSLPDDPLYGLKLAGEQLRLAVAVSPEDRAAVELSIAEHRLDEAQRLAANGREDDAIIATASYGSSLADAAAELASVESTDPGTAALVTQVRTSLAASLQRVAVTAARLAADPRTAATAEVLHAVAATSAPSQNSPATQIADQAAAITARLATFADEHADRADPSRTSPAGSDPPATPAVAPTNLNGRASATDRPTDTRQPARTAERAAQAPPANAGAARQAAEKANEAAWQALQAAEKAKRSGTRTPTTSPNHD